ncbi:MAG: class II aldolase/adducin family protein, partial [Actinomycetota bacterium]|nr:class II aldolase/adducin family protein [Actinomycetota bacterium]
ERERVAAAARRLAAAGLVVGTSGNVSARAGDHVVVTPTGGVLAELGADDLAVVSLDGERLDGRHEPTSELYLHLGVYARHGAGAVVHTHPPVATALSCVVDEVPCVHYEMLLLGGDVRVAPYATFGSPELASCVADALEGRTAALMANHGAVTYGADVDAAVRATELLEWACALYWRARAVGEPRVLTAEQRQAVVDFAVRTGYGTTREVSSE